MHLTTSMYFQESTQLKLSSKYKVELKQLSKMQQFFNCGQGNFRCKSAKRRRAKPDNSCTHSPVNKRQNIH